MHMETHTLAVAGAAAATAMLSRPTVIKNKALESIAARLKERASDIFAANERDMAAARAAGLDMSILARLDYGSKKLGESIAMLNALAGLPDPAGRVLESRRLDAGLTLRRVSCPIGLIALIFESRPDALVQMAGLAAKSGNAIIVKGGHEAEHTNRILAEAIAAAGVEAGLPESWLGSIETRDEVAELLGLDQYVDLVIPRGSNAFVRHIMNTSAIPVLGHAEGVCHVYVDVDADPNMAARIVVDSKAQYPAACNAAEVLLVHASAAPRVLPVIAAALENAGVRLDLCRQSMDILGPGSMRQLKLDVDWAVEYLSLRMAVRIVESIDDAIAHINHYGSGHTDSIVCESGATARRFMDEVDSASVFHNASTRFADGFRYGLGAEVGISTGKLHARGPMGLDGLMTYKWRLTGSGNIVAEYASGSKTFEHAELSPDMAGYHGES
jgi:glutamate-5-semialdehyde dehydrogenase